MENLNFFHYSLIWKVINCGYGLLFAFQLFNNQFLSINICLISLISVYILQYLVINPNIHNWSTLNIFPQPLSCSFGKQWHSFIECQIHGIPGIKTDVLSKRPFSVLMPCSPWQETIILQINNKDYCQSLFVKCSQTLDHFLFSPWLFLVTIFHQRRHEFDVNVLQFAAVRKPCPWGKRFLCIGQFGTSSWFLSITVIQSDSSALCGTKSCFADLQKKVHFFHLTVEILCA